MKRAIRTLSVFTLSLIISHQAHAKSAQDHFNEVIANVKNSVGTKYSYYGVYPGITRAEAFKLAKQGDKVISAHEDPALKGQFFYEKNEPHMQISVTFPNYGQDVPETRDSTEIRSPLVTVKRIAPRNAMFDKDSVIADIKAQLGEPDDLESKGVTHTFYYGYNRKKSDRELYSKCVEDFKNTKGTPRIPKELGQFLRAQVTVEGIQSVMDNCPSVLEQYKQEKTKELSPWVWLTFNEKKRDFNITMNYMGDDYLSPHNRKGPFYQAAQ